MSDPVARARALAPVLASRVPETRARQHLPQATIDDLHEGGFFTLLQPACFGGQEVDPGTFFDVQIALATGCASTAWVFSVLAVHAWQLALFPVQAQHDVWDDDPRALIGSSYAPTGRVEVEEGGYRLSGRWCFSSGSTHCGWFFLGGLIHGEGGPQMRTFLVPRSDVVLETCWDTVGLEGTGSNDVVVDGAWVPEHRTHRLGDGFSGRSPGLAVHDAPLFRLPFGQVFVRSVSTTILGVLGGALDAYLGVAREKIAASNRGKISLDPVSQRVCAQAIATLDAEKLVLHRSFEEMMAQVRAGEPIPILRRVQFRYESARAVQHCLAAVDALFTTSGGRAIFRDAPIQRFFQDAHAVAAHFANKPDGPCRNLGGVLLGAENTDLFL